MARLMLRVVGLCTLAVAIVVPGCQALFPRDGGGTVRPGPAAVERDGQRP